jgi:hypothetical protein
MARMCSRKPPDDVPSTAERKMFVRMENELTNECLVLHSVGLARHATKPWSEIDFVLIGPRLWTPVPVTDPGLLGILFGDEKYGGGRKRDLPAL